MHRRYSMMLTTTTSSTNAAFSASIRPLTHRLALRFEQIQDMPNCRQCRRRNHLPQLPPSRKQLKLALAFICDCAVLMRRGRRSRWTFTCHVSASAAVKTLKQYFAFKTPTSSFVPFAKLFLPWKGSATVAQTVALAWDLPCRP